MQRDPIAIIGIGCRFPAAPDPTVYWRLLRDGLDAADVAPPERTGRPPYHLPDVDQFDRGFFRLSAREATAMDPQQRLLLEVASEALEDGGQAVDALGGTSAGVFVGISTSDYALHTFTASGAIDPYAGTGSALSIAANRISYLLDLRGPSLAVDTACSSSLVAVHLACASLREGECDLAIAGGVNLILSARPTLAATTGGFLAADGRCKPFDARADGYVRGEGVGVVVLKPLARAVSDGDPVYAVIRGSAVNQDGRSNGLTAPSRWAQAAVLRAAYSNAGVSADLVDYVEAHGTGTALGDPIEVSALASVVGPCSIGSVKSNIGHLEAAAGIAGLIKVALALHHRTLPPSLHVQQLNPHIAWDEVPVRVQLHTEAWPEHGRPRLAGVSSFGFGGTNAHVVVEQAPLSRDVAPSANPGVYVLPISACSQSALHSLAGSYRTWLSDRDIADVCHTASARRAHHPYRLAVVGASADELVAGLETGAPSSLDLGKTSPPGGRGSGLVFVFAGQGGQWAGMGRQLLENEPSFRVAVEACDEALRHHTGWSVLERLSSGDPLESVDVVQPALFAVQVGLAACWQALGLERDAVVGHSLGEVAAAYVSGVLSLEDAARVVVERSQLLARLRGRGGLLLVDSGPEVIERIVERSGGRVAVAAYNSRQSIVISGDVDALERCKRELELNGRLSRRIGVDVPAHGPQVDELATELRRRLNGLVPRPARIPLYSSTQLEEVTPDADFWARNLRGPVVFASAAQQLLDDGYTAFVEIGPHPVLTTAIEQTAQDLGKAAVVVGSTRRNRDDRRELLNSLAELYAAGCAIDWRRHWPNGGRSVQLPAYPWQHERFWQEGLGNGPQVGLPGRHTEVAAVQGLHVWDAQLEPTSVWVQEHRLDGTPVLPAAVSLSLALAAARQVLGPGPHRLAEVRFERLLAFPEDTARALQLSISTADSSYALRSAGGDRKWITHAIGRLRESVEAPANGGSLDELRGHCTQVLSVEEHYQWLDQAGLAYGPRYRLLDAIWTGQAEALARVRVPPQPELTPDPAVLDACLQVVAAAGVGGLALPTELEELRMYAPLPASEVWAHAQLRSPETADVRVFASDGQLLVEATGLRIQPLDSAPSTYQLTWRQLADAPSSSPEDVWLVLADRGGIGQALAALDPRVRLAEPDGIDLRCTHLIDLRALDSAVPDASVLGNHLTLVQTLAGWSERAPPRLWLVTQAAQAVVDTDQLTGMAQAPVWGFGRVVGHEHPRLRCTLLDLPRIDAAAALRHAIDHADDADQVAVRNGRRFAPRLEPLAIDGRRPPAVGEVEVRVAYAGLNFSDVLKTLGEYSGPGDAATGIECSGTVERVGQGVERLGIGMPVIVVAPERGGSFRSRLTVPASHVLEAPTGLSLEQVATLPVAYTTAAYALVHVAQLRAGERVLIHSAAGGVGHAAIHLARQLGSEILATAGNPAKRSYLREVLGVEKVFDSRATDLAEQVLAETDGQGVDVLVGAFSPEAAERIRSVLGPGGRFADLAGFNLAQLSSAEPAQLGELWAELVPAFQNSTLPPLPTTVFPLSAAEAAIAWMASAQHIGKIVVFADPIRPDATYLITGGLGALGLLLAEWLVHQGARTLVLLGRNPPSASAKDILEGLRRTGAQVVTANVDVTNQAELARMLEETRRTLPPLRGVIHAAGVLDECAIAELDPERLSSALAPKMIGAWNLDQLTRADQVDWFVLFSSAAGLFGLPTQASHAAGNAFLDALAHSRRAEGLPALSIDWGHWAVRGRPAPDVARLGVASLTPTQGLETLDRLLGTPGPAQVAVLRADWRRLATDLGRNEGAPSLLQDLLVSQPPSVPSTLRLSHKLKGLPAEARPAALLHELQSQVARMLRVGASELDPDGNLLSLGMDSLLSIELRHWIETQLGAHVSVVSLLRGPSLRQVAQELLASIATDGVTLPLCAEAPGEYALSAGERALWFLHQLDPHSHAYTLVRALRIHGNLNVDALRRAVRRLVERHATLRSTFSARDGEPIRIVHPPSDEPLEVVDASAWPGPLFEERLAAEARHSFDLDVAPPVRLVIFERAPDEQVLLVAVHHIVADVWSLAVLVHELGELYAAELLGQVPILAEVSAHASDAATWQRALLSSEQGQRLATFWREQLSGDLAPLDVPTDRPRPPEQTCRGASHHFAIDASLVRRLRSLAVEQDATLYVLLLAAFQVLLHRLTGATDIRVGSPVAGRNRSELAHTVGYFVNTLVMRGRPRPDVAFTQFLAEVRETTLAALQHQDYPFGSLVAELRPVRDPSRSPLVDVLFVLQTVPRLGENDLAPLALGTDGGRLSLGGLQAESIRLLQAGAAFDLVLTLGEAGDGRLAAVLNYNTDLFDADTATRLGEQYVTLLAGIADAPSRRIGDLPLLSPAQERLLLIDWNATQRDFGFDGCLHTLVEAQVQRTPEAVAVRFEGRELTYAELDARAEALAGVLRGRGVEPDVLVGACLERSLDLVVGLLAVLKAGGAYVALDPEQPQARLAVILEDARPGVVLGQHRLANRLSGITADLLYVDDPVPFVVRPAHHERDEAYHQRHVPAADNLAYVIYTSGSTGRPKGVLSTHRGICNRLLWMQDAYRLQPGERVLHKTPLGFDVSVWELFWPLVAGGCVVLARPGGQRDPAYLSQFLHAEHISTIHFVPSMLRAWLDSNPPHLDRLCRVMCSGEALPSALVEGFFKQLPETELHNLYGPTEASIDATAWACRPEDAARPIPIGRPIANMRTYVLDTERRPVPIGVPGELYLGGVGLARGYLNRADLTAERFVPDPFDTVPGARMYRTGDRARFRSDSALEYLGRVDDQVKVRGVRVEPGEVVASLRQHPLVKDAALLSNDSTLVAYVVPTDGPLAPTELREFLRQRLPEVMVPSTFVELPDLPRLPNGKLDRAALPKPEPGVDRPTDAAPSDFLEFQLVEIFERALGVPVSLDDDFFDLGGHSLLALRVIAEVRTRVHAHIPPMALLQAPSPRRLANLVRAQAVDWPVLVPFGSEGDGQPLFLATAGWGDLLGLARLARHLGSAFRVYGLQPSPALVTARSSLDDVAVAYVSAIRAVQPAGPYHLGGYSIGGLLALEAARQLDCLGEDVQRLMLLDTAYPGSRWRPYTLARMAAGRDAGLAAQLRAVRGYVPRPYSGRTALFITRRSPMTHGWEQVALGGLDITIIPGRHDTVLREPHVGALAEALRAYLPVPTQ